MKKKVFILISIISLLVPMVAFAIDTLDVGVIVAINAINYVLSIPEAAELHFEERSSSQVEITIMPPENSVVYYTTNGKKATEKSLLYDEPLVVDIGTELNLLTYDYGTGRSKRSSVTVERNDVPSLSIEDNPQLGSLIILDDSARFSDLPIWFSISTSDSVLNKDQIFLKETAEWQEYTSPIDISEIPYNDFAIAYMIPACDDKLSSDVIVENFHTVSGSCFNYVFYDKGSYSDGWRYIEICPIEHEDTFGGVGISTGATNQKIGAGLQNTIDIVSSIGEIDSTLQKASYAAKTAMNCIYVNCDDWYLPSLDELKLAKEVYPDLFSSFSDYWSSSERDSEKAYTLRWSRDKDVELKYFVVRRF